MKVKCGIYRLVWQDGSFYIGSSCNFANRWKVHRHSMVTGTRINPKVLAKYESHGLPKFEVIDLCERSELADKEAALLNAHIGSILCLNISRRSPPEVRALLGDKKAYRAALLATPHIRKQMEEHRSTEEYKAAQSAYKKTHRALPEVKERRRQADEKYRQSPQYKAKKREYDRARYYATKSNEPN
jgi:predicted GIY-YIG superfamily endonuclease